MNEQILKRTDQKLKQNAEAAQHTWTYELDGISREYDVFPNVFSPAIFMGTSWLTTNVLKLVKPHQSILEIGTGCGVTSIQISLRIPNCQVSACDLNQAAVYNTKHNADKYKANFSIKQSDIFSNYQNECFDIIYWNFPFHPTESKYQQLTMLEKAVRDPGYNLLKRFLQSAEKYLNKQGYVLLGFSFRMGDIKLLTQLAEERGWKVNQVARMDGTSGSMCLIRLNK